MSACDSVLRISAGQLRAYPADSVYLAAEYPHVAACGADHHSRCRFRLWSLSRDKSVAAVRKTLDDIEHTVRIRMA